MIRYIKKSIPKDVLEWFNLNFPTPHFSYKFYYYLKDNNKPKNAENIIYGCFIYNNLKNCFWHNATQANIYWFRKNKLNKIY